MRAVAIPLLALLCGSSLATEPRLRVLVETDIGGDPDDEGSLVRFLLYTNEWDVEGIVCDRPRTKNQGAKSGRELAQKIIAAYGECHPDLIQHDEGYPTAEALLAVTVPGYDHSSEGVDLIKKVLTRSHPRPIWYANWGSDSGTKSNILRALDQLEKELPPARFSEVLGKLHVTRNAEKLGSHAAGIALFVDTRTPDRWYHQFSRMTKTAGGGGFISGQNTIEPPGQLYHLEDDLGETKNLYSEHPAIVARLSAQLKKIICEGRSRQSRWAGQFPATNVSVAGNTRRAHPKTARFRSPCLPCHGTFTTSPTRRTSASSPAASCATARPWTGNTTSSASAISPSPGRSSPSTACPPPCGASDRSPALSPRPADLPRVISPSHL